MACAQLNTSALLTGFLIAVIGMVIAVMSRHLTIVDLTAFLRICQDGRDRRSTVFVYMHHILFEGVIVMGEIKIP